MSFNETGAEISANHFISQKSYSFGTNDMTWECAIRGINSDGSAWTMGAAFDNPWFYASLGWERSDGSKVEYAGYSGYADEYPNDNT